MEFKKKHIMLQMVVWVPSMNDVTHLVHLYPWVGGSKKWVTSFMHDTQTTFFYHWCQSMNDVTHLVHLSPEWVKSNNGWHHLCMTPRLFYCIVGNRHHFELWTRNFKSRKFKINKNSYFLHWNFDWKSCFVVFFLEWNEWKNPQFNFSCQNLSLERNFFK